MRWRWRDMVRAMLRVALRLLREVRDRPHLLVELAQVLLQGGDLLFRASLGLLGALEAGGHLLLLLLEPLDAVLELLALRREALLLLLGLLVVVLGEILRG